MHDTFSFKCFFYHLHFLRVMGIGQGRAGQGRAGQGRAGQGRAQFELLILLTLHTKQVHQPKINLNFIVHSMIIIVFTHSPEIIEKIL